MVFFQGISGKYLPIHLKPQPDELLSSWITRLAQAHGLKLHTFCKLLWGNRQIWPRDIDKSCIDKIIQSLSILTGTPIERCNNTILKKYEHHLFDKYIVNGNTSWIIPWGIYHRTRKRNALQFCPLCLKEDLSPYFRCSWRLALSYSCIKHQIFLFDSCPQCHSPIIFFRQELGHKNEVEIENLCKCFSCKFDLRTTKIIKNSHCPIDFITIQKTLYDFLNKGIIKTTKEMIPSVDFFIVLKQILKIINGSIGNKRTFLNSILKQDYDLTTNHDLSKIMHGSSFESLDVYSRAYSIVMAIKFLNISEWPDSFILSCRKGLIFSADLVKDMEKIPFFYYKIILLYLFDPYVLANRQY